MNAPVTLATEFMLYVASTHVKTLKHGKVAVSCPDLKLHQSVCLSDMPKVVLASAVGTGRKKVRCAVSSPATV